MSKTQGEIPAAGGVIPGAVPPQAGLFLVENSKKTGAQQCSMKHDGIYIFTTQGLGGAE